MALFEERKQAIIDEYDEKRRAAQEAGNTEMVEAIDRAQAQAFQNSPLTNYRHTRIGN